MSDHPRCPYCGSTLEGFEGPEELEAQAVFHFSEIRRANEIADLLEYELEGSSSEIPEPLREWRLRHPKRSSPDGDNTGEKSPETAEETT
jgi:hypothetical protein